VSQVVALDRTFLTERVGKLSAAKVELLLSGIDVVLGRQTADRKPIWANSKEAAEAASLARMLVDGRRLELPTSALRTNGGTGRIWLSVRDVNDASPRNRSDVGRRVFAPGAGLLGNRGRPCRPCP
jgi:hypothetical protein